MHIYYPLRTLSHFYSFTTELYFYETKLIKSIELLNLLTINNIYCIFLHSSKTMDDTSHRNFFICSLSMNNCIRLI